MCFESIDGYLLGAAPSKDALIERILERKSDLEEAQPFYRALEAVGSRAADEAFIALRLILSGERPSDERISRLRALSAVARASAGGDRPALRSLLKRHAQVLEDVRLGTNDDPDVLAERAAAAYRREVAAR